MKDLINDFIRQNNNVLEILSHASLDLDNLDKEMPAYSKQLRQTNFNAAMGIDFAAILQLSNDKKVFNQYDLDDISKLFDSLIKLQSNNLDTYLESANFEWSIMNNNDKAKEVINQGLDKARQKLNELTKLLDDINGD